MATGTTKTIDLTTPSPEGVSLLDDRHAILDMIRDPDNRGEHEALFLAARVAINGYDALDRFLGMGQFKKWVTREVHGLMPQLIPNGEFGLGENNYRRNETGLYVFGANSSDKLDWFTMVSIGNLQAPQALERYWLDFAYHAGELGSLVGGETIKIENVEDTTVPDAGQESTPRVLAAV